MGLDHLAGLTHHITSNAREQTTQMKIAVITGASKGIGLETARRFQSAGHHVVNISRSHGGFDQGDWLQADLAAPDWISGIADRLVDLVTGAEQVTIIHNAALLLNDNTKESDDDTIRRVFQINLLAPIQLNRALLPHAGAGSSILYVGSTLSEIAAPDSLSYVTSKHGLVGLMRATALEIAGREMHTACICPGVTDTAMARKHFGGDDNIEKFTQQAVLLRRLVTPGEIADLLLFCAGAPAINGALIHANLGQVGT